MYSVNSDSKGDLMSSFFLFLANIGYAGETEIRIGSSLAYWDTITTMPQIEVGKPKGAIGIRSLLAINTLFAHANVYQFSDNFRSLIGVTANNSLFTYASVYPGAYAGIEFHSKWVTIRPTVGFVYNEEFFMTYTIDTLFNIRIK